jgi:uncharacterized membrane protein
MALEPRRACVLGLALVVGCDDTIFHTREVVHAPPFEDVRAIFDRSCIGCHVGVSAEAGLDLSTDPCAALDDAGLVVAGDPDLSQLYVRMRSTSAPMPPSGRLPDDELAVVEAWIAGGAECDPES